jgi:hypothetical protein
MSFESNDIQMLERFQCALQWGYTINKRSLMTKNYGDLKSTKKCLKCSQVPISVPSILECKLEQHIMLKLESWYTFENIISRDITKVTCANLDMLWVHYGHLKIWDIIIVPKLTMCPKSLGEFCSLWCNLHMEL